MKFKEILPNLVVIGSLVFNQSTTLPAEAKNDSATDQIGEKTEQLNQSFGKNLRNWREKRRIKKQQEQTQCAKNPNSSFKKFRIGKYQINKNCK